MNECNNNETLNEVQKLKKEMGVIQKQLQSIVTILQGVKSLQPEPTYAQAVRKHGPVGTQEKGQFRKPMLPRTQYYPVQRYEKEQQRSVQCWICGKDGHISRFCTMNRFNFRCNCCGRQGHTARDCRDRRKSLNVRQIQDHWESDDEYRYYNGNNGCNL